MSSYRFDQDLMNKINGSFNIVDLVGNSSKVIGFRNTSGGQYVGYTNPNSRSKSSLKVNSLTGEWHDMAAGVGGVALHWIGYEAGFTNFTGQNFIEVVKLAADRAGIELSGLAEREEGDIQERNNLENVLTEAAENYHNNLKDKPELYNLIEGKWGITKETVDRYKLGYATEYRNLHELDQSILKKSGLVKVEGSRINEIFHDRITFPYLKRGKVVYFVARAASDNTNPKYMKLMGCKEGQEYVSPLIQNSFFYGEDSLIGKRECVITEGVTDCLSMLQAGFPCISPVTKEFREADAPKLIQMLKRFDTVYICNDNENSNIGRDGALKTAVLLEKADIPVRIITLPRPEGVSKIDIAEYMKTHTSDDFRQLQEESLGLWEFKLSLADVPASTKTLNRLKYFKQFVKNDLEGMKQEEWEVFVNNDVREKFRLSKKDIKTTVTEALKNRQNGSKDEFNQYVEEDLECCCQVSAIFPYVLDDKGIGIIKLGEDQDNPGCCSKQIEYFIDTPVKITATSDDLDNDRNLYKVTIIHPIRNKIEVWRDQAELLTKPGLNRLISDGIICTDSSYRDVTEYLRKDILRAAKEEPQETVTSRTGWKRNNTIFVAGNEAYTKDGSLKVTISDKEIERCYKTSGSLEDWTEGLKEILQYEAVRINCYTAAAAPLVGLLKQPSILLHNTGKTSTGKTLRSSVAVSMFGDPIEIVKAADTTRTAAERGAYATDGHCSILDETGDSPNINNLAYLLGNGRGKQRGTITGREEVAKWFKAFILNGEFAMLKETAAQGEMGRVIECPWVIPFNPDLAKRIETVIRDTYGHLTGKILLKIFEKKDKIPARYEEICKELPLVSVDAGNRIKDAFAILVLSGEILEEVFEEIGIEKIDAYELCKKLYIENVTGERLRPYWLRSLSIIYDEISSARQEVDSEGRFTGNYFINGEFAGSSTADYIDILPAPLRKICERKELKYSQLIKEWADNDVTETDTGKNQKTERYHGKTIKVIRLKLKELYEKLNITDANSLGKNIVNSNGIEVELLKYQIGKFAYSEYSGKVSDLDEFRKNFMGEYPDYNKTFTENEIRDMIKYMSCRGWTAIQGETGHIST